MLDTVRQRSIGRSLNSSCPSTARHFEGVRLAPVLSLVAIGENWGTGHWGADSQIRPGNGAGEPYPALFLFGLREGSVGGLVGGNEGAGGEVGGGLQPPELGPCAPLLRVLRACRVAAGASQRPLPRPLTLRNRTQRPFVGLGALSDLPVPATSLVAVDVKA